MRGLLGGLLLLALAGPGVAAGVDPALKAFLAGFGEAVQKSDLNAVAGMTHFPLQQEAYQAPNTVAKSAFRKTFDFLKGDAFGACLKKTTPARAQPEDKRLGLWAIDCDGHEFYFAEFDGRWRFSGYQNVNE